MKLSHNESLLHLKIEKSLLEVPSEILIKRWEEAIFHENHITPRSYHTAVIYKSLLYVYGGYECNQGILNDFYSINLESKEAFVWKNIEKPKGIYPEALHRHSAILYHDKMYIYGGKTSVLNNSSRFYSYDFESTEWSLLCGTNEYVNNKDEILPFYIDSHNAVLYEENNAAEMIVFGGFLGKISKYSKNIFAFDLKKQEWKFYFKALPNKSKKNNFSKSEQIKQTPKSRANSSIALIKNLLYVFGGCKGSLKLNDLWKFDLVNCLWQEIVYQKKITPEPRSGHIFLPITRDSILLFGGIHNIAHEKNDVLCFDNSKNEWFKIEEDSMKNLSETIHPFNPKKDYSFHKNNDKSPESFIQLSNEKQTNKTHRKAPSVYFIHSLKNRNYNENSRKLSALEQSLNSSTGIKSPMQMKEQRVKKEKQMKKMVLLAEFEVKEEFKPNLLENSPTIEAMKNSISAIKGDSKINLHENKIKQHKEKNEIIVSYNSNTMRGKKPCARDGATCNVFGDRLIIFGGDRHLMAFHDLYFLNIKHLI